MSFLFSITFHYNSQQKNYFITTTLEIITTIMRTRTIYGQTQAVIKRLALVTDRSAGWEVSAETCMRWDNFSWGPRQGRLTLCIGHMYYLQFFLSTNGSYYHMLTDLRRRIWKYNYCERSQLHNYALRRVIAPDVLKRLVSLLKTSERWHLCISRHTDIILPGIICS